MRIMGATSDRVLHAVRAQAVSASSGDYMNSSPVYTDDLVEEGGLELLRKAAS